MKKWYRTGLMIILLLVVLIFVAYLCSRFVFTGRTKKAFSVVVDNIKGYNYTLDERDSKLMRTKFKELKKVLDKKDIDYKEYSSLLSQLFIIDLYDIDRKVNKYDIPCLEYIYNDEVDKFKKLIKYDFYSKLEDNSDGNRKQELPSIKSIEVESIEETSTKVNGVPYKGYLVKLSWEYEKDLGYDSKALITTVVDNDKVYIVKHSPIIDWFLWYFAYNIFWGEKRWKSLILLIYYLFH